MVDGFNRRRSYDIFYNPLRGTVRPQGRLIQRAIREVI